jgi:hypothetical protein
MCNNNERHLDKDIEERLILQRAWENARGIMQHENDLVNHRISAFLTLQGFLFAAYGVVAGGFANKDNEDYRIFLGFILLIIAFFGFVTPRIFDPIIRAAYRHVAATREWWRLFRNNDFVDENNQKISYRIKHPFPEHTGERAMSYHWLCFRKPVEKDGQYGIGDKNLDLDYKGKKHINGINEAKSGIHKIPVYFEWLWVSILIFTILFFVYKFYHQDRLKEKEPIIILEDKVNGGVSKTIIDFISPGFISFTNYISEYQQSFNNASRGLTITLIENNQKNEKDKKHLDKRAISRSVTNRNKCFR